MRCLNLRHLRSAIACLGLGLLSAKSSAVLIVFDYTHDTFFSGNATAKAALEQAGADISSVLTQPLGAITTDPIQGTSGGTTATLNAKFSYTNPSTGDPVSILDTTMPANEFRIFVGTRNLGDSTLGQGGPGGVGLDLGASGVGSEWVDALANAEGLFNAQYQRGGPVFNNLSGPFNFDGATVNFNLNFGPTIGNLWFDVDTDNNGVTDTSGELENFWHFDHTTSVAPLKYDFYSVALHEILHSFGFGSADAFEALVENGEDWTGSTVIAELGSGTGVLDPDSSHIAESTMSTAITDSSSQEAVMDPTLTNGQRKYLTTLDLAFYTDMGVEVTVPEPGTVSLYTGLLILSFCIFKRTRKQLCGSIEPVRAHRKSCPVAPLM